MGVVFSAAIFGMMIQPVQLYRQRLARITSMPMSWHAQRQLLGFI